LRKLLVVAAALLVGLMIVAAVAPTSSEAQAAKSFKVSSRIGWQQTPLYVGKGSEYSVAYKIGDWTVDYRNFEYVGPQGYPPSIDSQIYQGCKLNSNWPYARLLGKVGKNGSLFSVGGNSFSNLGDVRTFTASTNGSLYLRIHDDDGCLEDNGGSITVNLSTGKEPGTGGSFKFPWPATKKLKFTGGPHYWTNPDIRSGLDFASSASSTHILAMASGTVTFAGDEQCHLGKCKTVKVSHDNGLEVWYVHLSSFQSDIAKKCTPSCSFPVKQGQWLGNEGNTGTTPVHIHIELRKDGKPVAWDGHSIDGWKIHENCAGFKESYNDNTQQPDAVCVAGNYDGYISQNMTHIVPLSSSKKGAQQYSLESTNQEK
jgi:hypothetical protein